MDVPIDVTTTVIETERLLLRAWEERDLADFFAYASVPGVGEMAGWPAHQTIEETSNILAMFRAGKSVFAIVHKQDNKVIGSLGLHQSWANEATEYMHLYAKEIGYVLSKSYWGHGLMPEAVHAVIDYYFKHSPINAFTCGHFCSNSQSQRVIEKCGFQFVEQSTYFAAMLKQTFEDRKYILLKEN